MKKRTLSGLAAIVVLLSSCSGGNGHYDWHKTLALVIIILIIGSFFVLALYSNLLRDEVDDCNAFEANAEKIKQKRRSLFFKSNNPFSLSRVQLAVWTVVISCSYIYLQLCMGGSCPATELNQTALVLMGISAAVTATGTIMDKRDILNGQPRHQNSPSEGFFADILSDDNGVSVHRFQEVVWTGLAIIIYLNKVYETKTGCALPELSPTLLALTGISSATYLAIKSQENNPPVAAAVSANQAADNAALAMAQMPAPVAVAVPAAPVNPPVAPLADPAGLQNIPPA